MSQAIRPRVGKEFEGESKCCVSVVLFVIVHQFVWTGDCICVWSSLPVVTFGYQPMLILCYANTFSLYSNVVCWLIRTRWLAIV